MKKVTLKVSLHQLQCVTGLLEDTLSNARHYGYTDDPNDKLILANLGELYEKLNGAKSAFINQYKLKVSVAQGLAFTMHCLALPEGTTTDPVTVNHVISLIDKQTVIKSKQ